jgi:hypothetical protein
MKNINQVFKNFYTKDEYLDLSNYVENFARPSYKYAKEHALGRYYGVIQDKLNTQEEIGNFPKHLLNKTIVFAENFFNVKPLIVFDIIIIKYCTDHGFIPKLDMHVDGGSRTKYTLDYQYKSNIDWSVKVEEKSFDLKDNDLVTFIGSEQKHGRDNRNFKNGEFLENIFFQFIEKRN